MPHKTESGKTAKTPKDDSQKTCCHDAGHHFTDDLREKAHHAGQEVRKYVSSATDSFDHVTHDLENNIRKEPFKTALVAFGVGYFLGLLTSRR